MDKNDNNVEEIIPENIEDSRIVDEALEELIIFDQENPTVVEGGKNNVRKILHERMEQNEAALKEFDMFTEKLFNKVSNLGDKGLITPLMTAAVNADIHVVNILIEAGAEVNTEVEETGETALTLVREELVLKRLVKSSTKLHQKTRFIREEDIKEQLKTAASAEDNHDLVKIIEATCPEERFTKLEREEMEELFLLVPVYKQIRERLLVAGGYDVRNLKNPETK